jgi:cyclopropane fatty-acyl-phospholipid synthase-like methyltransferase
LYYQKNYQKKKLKQADLRKDKIPFKEKFDLIFSNDFIYYLNKDELQFHFESISKSLKKRGIYLFQFIENDFVLPKKILSYDFSKRIYIKKFSEKYNPITFYKLQYFEKIIKKFKFNLIGKKFVIESYGINEKKIRINKYLLISK